MEESEAVQCYRKAAEQGLARYQSKLDAATKQEMESLQTQ